jgi:hypothetical protein
VSKKLFFLVGVLIGRTSTSLSGSVTLLGSFLGRLLIEGWGKGWGKSSISLSGSVTLLGSFLGRFLIEVLIEGWGKGWGKSSMSLSGSVTLLGSYFGGGRIGVVFARADGTSGSLSDSVTDSVVDVATLKLMKSNAQIYNKKCKKLTV